MATGEGGAADALFDDENGGDTQGGGDGSDTMEGGGGDDTQSGGDAPDWFEKLSAEADGDKPSHRDYATTKGFKTVDDLMKSYREAEGALRASGRIAVPGDGAKPEDVAAFRTAIGVPEKADDYEFKLPEGHEGVELDEELVGVLRQAAHEAGVPKAGFDQLASSFIKAQLDRHVAEVQRQDGLTQGKFKEWGAEKDAKLADAVAARKALGFDNKDTIALQTAIGSDRLLEMLAKLGNGMSEDVLVDGGKGQFGVTGEQAVREIETLKGDADFQKKVMVKGSPERARWDRLNAAAAQWKARQDVAA